MSKLLVERHLNGTLNVKNSEYSHMDKIHVGALFTLVLDLEEK